MIYLERGFLPATFLPANFFAPADPPRTGFPADFFAAAFLGANFFTPGFDGRDVSDFFSSRYFFSSRKVRPSVLLKGAGFLSPADFFFTDDLPVGFAESVVSARHVLR